MWINVSHKPSASDTALTIRGGSKINLLSTRDSNTLENQSHFKAILKSPGTYSSAALAVKAWEMDWSADIQQL